MERSRVLTAIGVDTRTDLPRIVRLSRLDRVLCLLRPDGLARRERWWRTTVERLLPAGEAVIGDMDSTGNPR